MHGLHFETLLCEARLGHGSTTFWCSFHLIVSPQWQRATYFRPMPCAFISLSSKLPFSSVRLREQVYIARSTYKNCSKILNTRLPRDGRCAGATHEISR